MKLLLLFLASSCCAGQIHTYRVLRFTAQYGQLPQPSATPIPDYQRDAKWQSLDRQRIALIQGITRNRLELQYLDTQASLSPTESTRARQLTIFLHNQGKAILSILAQQQAIKDAYRLRDLRATPPPIRRN